MTLAVPWRNVAGIVASMYGRDLSEDERDEETVLTLLELMRQFGDP
jgi:hypothetical protein